MESSSKYRVGLIGAGIMGEALLAALIKAGFSSSEITISDKRNDRLEELKSKYGCAVTSTEVSVPDSHNLLLVVKPQDMDALLEKVGKSISRNQRVISFAAGKKTSGIEKYLNEGVPVLRVMPNTPMSVGVGASAISKGLYATDDDVKAVEELLKASGKTIVVDESLQDAVTATSGSGPAYFFRFVEAMIAGAQDLGLNESDARTLVIQTITGAAAMLNQEGADPGVLRQNVTSPNGTTFAALQVFESGDLEGLIKRAMKAARDRSQELS
ncbi:MAG: pyrroline-5-carboxylate reductase [Candidatus Nanopelagicaceae bacterium]|nr:pyrroline-5-carboxylate reductase [Candidatus Nanopelagicaceae bacterium]